MPERTASRVRKDVLRPIHIQADRIMCVVCWSLWVVSLSVAPIHNTWLVWLVGASALSLAGTALAFFAGGSAFSRNTIAVLFMLFAALLIHQTGGTIEAHFVIFALLSFLLFYRDLVPICVATLTTALHHYVFCQLQMSGYPVFVFPPNHPCSMIWVHIVCVLFEAVVLVLLARMICREALEAGSIAALGQRMAQTGSIDLVLAGHEAQGTSSQALLNLLTVIKETVAQTATVAHGVSGVSEDMTTAAGRMVSAGRKQHITSATVVQAVERISAATEEITSNCSEVAGVAHSCAAAVERGREAMARSVRQIESLAQSVSSLSGQIAQSNASTARIEDILELIVGFADQTNLLALNASIEAARAGEYGRGFAVVAQEVRDLSDRTHRTLTHAQSIFDATRVQTAQLIASATHCRQDALRGGAQITDANNALEGVLRELPHIGERADSVIRICRHHRELTGDVVEHMREIAAAVSRNASDLDHIDSLGNSLRTLSSNLCRGLDIFRLHRAPAIS